MPFENMLKSVMDPAMRRLLDEQQGSSKDMLKGMGFDEAEAALDPEAEKNAPEKAEPAKAEKKDPKVAKAATKVVGKAIWRKMLAALKEREVEQLQNLLHRCIRGLDAQVEQARPAKPAAASSPAKAA